MCSFLVTNRKIRDLQRVNHLMKFRGPDHTKAITTKGITFLHNLLSITGRFRTQPFVDDDIVCVFNGEIYNYEDLNTGGAESDGDVLIPLYRKFGPSFIRRLDGEFAVVLVDFRNNLAVMSTDVFATKPLWAAVKSGEFGLASYKSALTRAGFEESHIRRMPANMIKAVDLRTFETRFECPLFEFDIEHQHKKTYDDWIRAFRESIRKRSHNLREKIFIALSSGYDSGAIACELKNQKVPFKAFSILATENRDVILERHRLLENTELIELTEAQYKKSQGYIKENCEEFIYEIKRDVESAASPVEYMSDDQGAVGLSHICSIGRGEGIKIFLSGQGADEIYSDYGHDGHKFFSHSTFGGKFPRDMKKHFPWRSFYDSTQVSYLAKEEYISGGYGIEGRYPFLDKHLVQEFFWLDNTLKNKYYKAPVYEYLKREYFPFDKDKKIGFSCRDGLTLS